MMRLLKNVIFLALLGIVLIPPVALAAPQPGNTGPQAEFDNPLGDVRTLGPFLVRVINFLLGLVGLLALLSLIVGGIHMVGSFGKEDTIARGKKIILWAIAGLVVISLAWAILNLVINQFLGAQ